MSLQFISKELVLTYLRKIINKKNGRIYLSIAHNYRDKNTKSSRTTIIKSLGYLDELEKIYDDPISYFTAEAKKMEQQRLADNAPYTFTFAKNQRISTAFADHRNFGYTALSKIYHELGIHTFIINWQRHLAEEFDANTIMKLLVYSRMLYPSSNIDAFEKRTLFFENTDFTLDDLYRCLTFLISHRNNLHLWLNSRISQLYGRDMKVAYYYVTNYNFDMENTDASNGKGTSREYCPNPTVQMGLLMDGNSIPITYQLFPGNSNDCLTCRPDLSGLRKDYALDRVVIVADRGMVTGDYIWYTHFGGNGYVFSLSVRDANKELKEYLLDENGYERFEAKYKRKSRLYSRSAQVTTPGGKKLKKTICEKQIVLYLEELNKRAKADRTAVIAKAWDIILNPKKYTRSTAYGVSPYIKNISFDKRNGKILKTEKAMELDTEKLREEEKYDGYCVLVTSEYQETDDHIIRIFHELQKTEKSFLITLNDTEANLSYITKEGLIQSHYLICFVALVIARLLEMKTEQKYSIAQLLESLQRAECSHLQQNYYLFDYYDDILKDIGEKLGIDFSKKILSLKEIKEYLGDTRK